MNPVGIVAVVAAIVGPVQSVGGWLLAGSLWPGYDPIRQTISDLAANESPVKWVMSSFFILGGTLSLIGAWFARSIPKPARAALDRAGVAHDMVMRTGAVAQEIVKLGHSGGFDLIVMGTKGRSAFGDLLMGSVAQKVLSATQLPVTFIK